MNRLLTPLRHLPSIRTYSTSAPIPKSSSSLPYIGIATLLTAAVGGGYYYNSPALQRKEAEIVSEIKEKLAVGALSKKDFRAFKLVEVIPYNDNTSTFKFSIPPGTESGLSVASCLLTKGPTDSSGKPTIRPYTPISSPDNKDSIDLLIKNYPQGVVSKHIHGLKIGDELEMKGPLPKFNYKANEFQTIGMIAGGSGITPMWQIIQAIDRNPSDKTNVVLIFGNVEEKDILLRKEFEAIAARKPTQFQLIFTLDKPPKNWKGSKGYITQELLKTYLPASGLADQIKLFVCGPPAQMEMISGNKKSPSDQGELKGALADLGYAQKQVYKF